MLDVDEYPHFGITARPQDVVGVREQCGDADCTSALIHLAIGEVAILRGTVHYTNPRTKKVFVAENLDATASVGSFDGPLAIAGESRAAALASP